MDYIENRILTAEMRNKIRKYKILKVKFNWNLNWNPEKTEANSA